MPALWLGLVLAGPVVLVDNVSAEKEVPKTLGATLDPLMCNHFEKAFKNAKVQVKCRADIERDLAYQSIHTHKSDVSRIRVSDLTQHGNGKRKRSNGECRQSHEHHKCQMRHMAHKCHKGNMRRTHIHTHTPREPQEPPRATRAIRATQAT